MSNLLIEMGNTALKAAWSEGTTLGKTFRYQGERVIEYILSLTSKEKPEVMAVAAVAELSPSDTALLRAECGTLLLLDGSSPEILSSCGLPGYISGDRAASIMAARFLFKDKSCMVFDFGTTLTIDMIAPDGSYEGGRISPGCRTRFKSLERYSRSLPLVDTPEDMRLSSESLEASIGSGVISGIMFEIEGYVSRFPDHVVVFTGGDANYFAKRMKNSIFAVYNLVLMGLAIITNDYVKESDS